MTSRPFGQRDRAYIFGQDQLFRRQRLDRPSYPPAGVAHQPAVTRLAWALCILSVTLAVASVALAGFNGGNLLELVANHHAIGILNALVLPLIGALIVVGDRHHLLAWLLILAGAFLAVYNLAAQYAPCPRPHLATAVAALARWSSWSASWPGLHRGRLPSRRWRPVGWAGALLLVVPTAILAVGFWPLRGPQLITQEGSVPPLVGAMFWTAFQGALLLGAISVVALVLRFRRAGAVQRQQIKWFAYGAALSIPLSLFPEARPYGPYLEFLGTVLLLAGLGIGIFCYRLWDIDPAGQPDAGLRTAYRRPRYRLRRARPA